LVALVSVIVGAGASGSLAVVESGSLKIVTVGALSGTAVAGAAVAGWVASGAVWARSWVEDSARTAAIAVVARRSWGVLWVIIKVNEYETTMTPNYMRWRCTLLALASRFMKRAGLAAYSRSVLIRLFALNGIWRIHHRPSPGAPVTESRATLPPVGATS
jgi:hypothetical protein